MGKKRKAKDEPERKLLGSRSELWQPCPPPRLDEHDRPTDGRDPDGSPYEDDD